MSRPNSKANESDGMQVDWWDSLSQDERNNYMNSFSQINNTYPVDGTIYMDNYDEMDSSNQYYVKNLFTFVRDDMGYNVNDDLLGRNHNILEEVHEGLIDNIWGLLVNSSRMQFLDEYMGDMNIPLMITMGSMSMPQTNEEVADALGVSKSEALKFISKWAYDNGITDTVYTESKANEMLPPDRAFVTVYDSKEEAIADGANNPVLVEDTGKWYWNNYVWNVINFNASKASEFNIGTTMICPICNKEIETGNEDTFYHKSNFYDANSVPMSYKMENHFEQEHTPEDFGVQNKNFKGASGGYEAFEDWRTGNQLSLAFRNSFPEYNQDDATMMAKPSSDDTLDSDGNRMPDEWYIEQWKKKNGITESKAGEAISDSDKQILSDWVSQNTDWTTIDDLPEDIFIPLMAPFGDDIDKRVEAQVEIINYMKSLGESNVGAESWSQKSSIDRIEALEKLGIKQGDAVKLSGLEFEDFGEDLQGALKDDDDDKEEYVEVANPNSEFQQYYPDYNNIGESQTVRTKYECEYCDHGFKSNEALSIHYNDKHAIAPESLDGYASEDDPDFQNDPDFQGYTKDEFGNKVKSHPSQYTASGWDQEKKERMNARGDVDGSEFYASEHNVGDYVTMTDDALDNYGQQYRGQSFRISHVAKSVDDHMGYDEGMGGENLYDLDGFNSSLYDYEVESANESKASEADWDHLTAEDEAGLDRDIATLKTAFYREIEEGNSVDSTRILGELERLREIKRTRFESSESIANEAPFSGWLEDAKGNRTESAVYTCPYCHEQLDRGINIIGDARDHLMGKHGFDEDRSNEIIQKEWDIYGFPNSIYESKATETISEDEKDEIFQYLFDLQESGATNMFGSGAYVERDFPHLDKREVGDVITEWMANWDEIATRMGIESYATENPTSDGYSWSADQDEISRIQFQTNLTKEEKNREIQKIEKRQQEQEDLELEADTPRNRTGYFESKASEKGETYHFMWNHKQVRSQLLAQAGLSDEHSNKEWDEIPEEDKTVLKLIMNDMFYSNDYNTESKATEGKVKSYCNICGYDTWRNEGEDCPYHQRVLSDGTFLWDEFNQDGEGYDKYGNRHNETCPNCGNTEAPFLINDEFCNNCYVKPPESKWEKYDRYMSYGVSDADARSDIFTEAGLEDHSCPECGFITSDNSDYVDHLNAHEE